MISRCLNEFKKRTITALVPPLVQYNTIFTYPSRLVRRAEDLEHLLNEEATDITEMLKVINGIQCGKEGLDIKSLKKRYM